MVLYTPPSLPRTPPPSYNMDVALPPLPVELIATLSTWRHSSPLTPPDTITSSRRVLHSQVPQKTTLPPIACFDRDLSRLYPPSIQPFPLHQSVNETPPHSKHDYVSLKLPPMYSPASHSYPSPIYVDDKSYSVDNIVPSSPTPPPPSFDWLAASTQQSSQYLAEKTCEMICYLWFSPLSNTSPLSKRSCLGTQRDSTYGSHSNSTTASLQFSVSPAFIRFMQKVLETTQLSQSVIVLSLHYIYRMKMRNRFMSGRAGSEYRVAIAALMMANKFLDDNTYTNKTWSEVSGIDLVEINTMEKEFLLGIDFGLYVDEATYDSWLNLLKGLVMAKERECRQWRRSWRPSRSTRCRQTCSKHTSPFRCGTRAAPRARSTSPSRPTLPPPGFSSPEFHVAPQCHRSTFASHPQGTKRTANDAFSPTSATFSASKPPKRTTGLTLQIPEVAYHGGNSSGSSASPSEPLQGLANLSLGSSPIEEGTVPEWAASVRRDLPPQTLVSSYNVNEQRPSGAPQNLYFYSLACSPMHSAEEARFRKSRLRYHRPAAPIADEHRLRPPVPMVVQSACASPSEVHDRAPGMPALPPFANLSRDWPPAEAGRLAAGHRHTQQQAQPLMHHHPAGGESIVPSAPFANAGPPGFQFYHNATTASAPGLSPFATHRGRRM